MKCKATIKNSLIFEKRYKGLISYVSVLFILMAVNTVPLQAQMFSVGETTSNYNRPMSELFIGMGPIDANFKGSPGVDGAGAFEYSGPVISIGYNTPGVNLYLSTGGKVTGVEDRSYFHTGGNYNFGLSLYRSPKVSVRVPLRITSQYTNITSDRSWIYSTASRFQFGMIAVGGGLKGMWKPAKNIQVQAGAIPTYGFSFATGGSVGGSIGTVTAHGKLYFDRLFNDKGLSIGYKYDFRSYDIEDDIYDYDLKGHSFEIGITF